MQTETIITLFLAIITPIIGLLVWQFKQVAKDRQESARKFTELLEKQIETGQTQIAIHQDHSERSVKAYEAMADDMQKLAKSQRSLNTKFGNHMKAIRPLLAAAECKKKDEDSK